MDRPQPPAIPDQTPMPEPATPQPGTPGRPPAAGAPPPTSGAAPVGGQPSPGGAQQPSGAERPSGPETAAPPRSLLALPPLTASSDPSDLVQTDPVPPREGRPCGNPACRQLVGQVRSDLPTRHEGYCSHCGTPYSLLPQLTVGERLDQGRYEVLGCLAPGGQGWVYLAVDTRLDNRLIALKGVLNPHDPQARARMLDERNRMISLSHDSVVQIYDYVRHEPPDQRRIPAHYIAMRYVAGKSLRQILREERAGQRPLGPRQPLTLEHVARYGCQILGALTVLHERGLVHSDVKPDNVIHQGSRIVLIDLGGVQQDGDETRVPVTTEGYAAPETGPGKGPATVAHDLHTVGRTLLELAEAVPPDLVSEGLGSTSFRRVALRAVHPDPRRRFGTAAEMAAQLRGALWELVALRTGRAAPRETTVFDRSGLLLDQGLGAVPELGHWMGRQARAYRCPGISSPPLHPGRPAPRLVAAGLPVPKPARDPSWSTTPKDLRGMVRQLRRSVSRETADTSRTDRVEVRLRLCRTELRIAAEEPAGSPGGDRAVRNAAAWWEEADQIRRTPPVRLAEAWLSSAAAILGEPSQEPAADWRLSWHRGLLELARERVAAAKPHFDRVYAALPGEFAPKLALGCCAELVGDLTGAERYYEAVRRQNDQQGSAAFGLARIHLARGERRPAAEVLETVSDSSGHYEAARIAALRVRAARLEGDESALPDWDGLLRAAWALDELPLDGGQRSGGERARLTAEIREWALDWVRHAEPPRTSTHRADDSRRLAQLAHALYGGGGTGPSRRTRANRTRRPPAPAAPVPQVPTETGLRTLLAASFHELAWLPGTTRAEHEQLIDCAYAVHPRTWFRTPLLADREPAR